MENRVKLPLTKKKNTDPETAHDLEAYTLAQQEAQQGDAAAQFRLGWMHANGRGTAQNDRRAVAGSKKPPNKVTPKPNATSP